MSTGHEAAESPGLSASEPEIAAPETNGAGAEGVPGGTGAAAQPHPQPQPDPKTETETETETEQKLPPLTADEFRIYNRLATQMDYFHDHFRKSWDKLYQACVAGRRPSNMTLKQFIDEGLHLVRYLEAHHSIEESYLYPILARKMPEFRAATSKRDKDGDCELLRQHKAIHAGMDVFEAYLRACRNRECEFELSVLKEKMDSWGDVLMKHLDQEVRDLGAENMRKYWTLAEVRAIPV